MIHLCMEKNVALCKIIFELVSVFRPNFGPKFGPNGVAHTTQQINSTSHKKRILFLKSPFFSFNSFFQLIFVIFDLFLSHSYFLMILRIQHISLCFQFFFSGKYPRLWKQMAESTDKESLFEEILCEKQRHLTGDFRTVTLPVA